MAQLSTSGAPRRIRLTSAPADPSVSALRLGDSVPGDAVVVRRTHLERGGRPWFPVAGEYHYSRTDPARWREDLAALRSNGVTLVSTYAIWILHQPTPGAIDWSGALDLRRFVETAREVGLEVVLRIGPWVHGETRNGGFPDWVQSADVELRTDDPAYLELVTPWIGAMADELRGLFRSAETPDAPIIAIQVENELYDQPGHLSTLRRVAEEAGMSAPLWTATGWGGAELPPDEFLPVYAGYVDGFWEDSDAGWPANYAMHFRFSDERDDLGVGADVRAASAAGAAGETDADADADANAVADPGTGIDPGTGAVPYATCELGGGMPVAYHRRPHVDPEDVAAVALAKLASGSVFQGYYMYHGGVQVPGTQESQATGYPNDLPLRDYDFAAPLGSFGQRRRHADLLRLQHLFAQTAADVLAPAVPSFAEGEPRASLRADEEQGFLFFSTYQPAVAPLPAETVQFELTLGEHTVVVPSEAAEVPSGASFVWPVRRLLPDGSRFSATAQLVTELELDGVPTVVLVQTAGLPVEVVHETVAGRTDHHPVHPVAVPTVGNGLELGGARMIVLDAATAETLWRGEVDGVEHLVFSAADVGFDGGLSIRVADGPQTLTTIPALSRLGAGVQQLEGPDGLGGVYRVGLDGADGTADEVVVELVSEARGTAPVRHGGSGGRLSAPLDEDFALAARYRLRLPEAPETAETPETPEAAEGAGPRDRVILDLDWVGDVGRAHHDGLLVSDQFWSGRSWEIDVTGLSGELELALLPWSPDSAVHLDARVRPLADRERLAVHGARLHRSRLVRVTA
ncbi:beta-galactosidase [Herbiconiux sp. VKM Ac-1786]|uniref:beta-galactosidase n=1 Tax=Herbiconiux sp. VKM Ac-1786 TaxID=2783824 RepID=UPI00188C45CE|nr:beta-galactosidase [Herbiconiux sp. VKM Ac-1786]